MIKLSRLDEANEALRIIKPGSSFELKKNRLYINTFAGQMPVRLCSNGNSLGNNYGRLGMGGTEALAIGQLARWIRNDTRLPLTAWQHWSSDRVNLCDPSIVLFLKESSYMDEYKVCCVLCGEIPSNLDWWNLDGTIGPCCSGGKCMNYGKYLTKLKDEVLFHYENIKNNKETTRKEIIFAIEDLMAKNGISYSYNGGLPQKIKGQV